MLCNLVLHGSFYLCVCIISLEAGAMIDTTRVDGLNRFVDQRPPSLDLYTPENDDGQLLGL
jgi:hypothetical protein